MEKYYTFTCPVCGHTKLYRQCSCYSTQLIKTIKTDGTSVEPGQMSRKHNEKLDDYLSCGDCGEIWLTLEELIDAGAVVLTEDVITEEE